jgi:sulfoacetaldehyde dehydrogenase
VQGRGDLLAAPVEPADDHAEVVRLMREALRPAGAPEDLLQCVERPSIPLAQRADGERPDLTIATGGPAMVKAAYGSGKPAYGVGAGNATMVIDETATSPTRAQHAHQQDQRQRIGLLGDGNLLVDATIYDAFLEPLQRKAAISSTRRERTAARGVLGRRRPAHRRHHRQAAAGRRRQGGHSRCRRQDLLIVPSSTSAASTSSRPRSSDRAGHLQVPGFDDALEQGAADLRHRRQGALLRHLLARRRPHHRLALVAPVSRIMVRQMQSRANAGTFTNGMPMTSSMGCGVWGGNITNENIALKHYMNVTWVSRPIPEDKPPDAELFGEFYN